MSSSTQPDDSGPGGSAGDGVIFISHSSRDRKIAQTISGALEHRGFRCWISSRDIGPGENFQEAIVRAIRGSRLMVLVFTGHANNSNEIKKEMALASQNNLAVIPIRVEDVVPNDAFAYEFATRQWIDTFDNWEQAIERLSLQVGTVLRGGSMAEALAAVAAAPPAPIPPPAPLPSPPESKRMAGLAVAALALLVLAAGGAYFAFERAPQRPAGLPASVPPAAAPQAAAPLAAAPQAAASPAAAPEAAAGAAPAAQAIAADANRAYRGANYDEAFRLYQQAAGQGLPAPEFWLGLLYHRGLGTQRDFAQAMDWYRKSADQGFAPAMAGIGQLYHFGQGVPQDFAEALRWFQQAADKGAPNGMIGLGNLYEMGQGVPQDYGEAMRWYRQAADRNGPNAGYFIGLLYERGLGVPANQRQARLWMRKAADLGSDDAQSWLSTHKPLRDQ
jgi:hypothetical protein